MTRTLLVMAVTAGIVLAQAATAAGDAEAGREKAAACQQCHGIDGNGTTPQFPKIGGQHAGYIVQALEDYKTGVRQDPVMAAFAIGLSKQDREDLAAWYSSQDGLYTIKFDE